MQLKSSYLSSSTRHLYEFAEEVANFGSLTDRILAAEESTDATAARNAAAKWRDKRDQANSLSGE